MKKITSLFLCLIFPISSYAVKGPLVEKDQIPPQLCRIVPTVPEQMANVNNVCSAIIVGETKLLTAGHCGFKNYSKGLGVCYGGDRNIVFSKENMQFPDPNNILNPQFQVGPYDRIDRDFALIETEKSMDTPAVEIFKQEDKEAVLKAMAEGRCLMAGVGFTNVGVGLASAGFAPPFDVKSLKYNRPLFIKGKPHVAGHDSGGGFFCPGADKELKLVGTLVAQKGKGSVIAHFFSNENREWLSEAMGVDLGSIE